MLLDERYVLKDSAQLRDYYTASHLGVLHKQIDHVDGPFPSETHETHEECNVN